jgi:hypothetical protein
VKRSRSAVFGNIWKTIFVVLWNVCCILLYCMLKRGGCENLTLVFWNRAVALRKWYFETYMFLFSLERLKLDCETNGC